MFSSLPTDYHDFIGWHWPQLEPSYQNLIERTLSADSIATWLAEQQAA